MATIKVPTFGKKYGLLVSDTDVLLLSWKGGDFERIAVFTNDEAGVDDFAAFMQKNAKTYKHCGFQVMTNIIGEDYRLERVAHLIGKYKTDFHNRRMQQLFRGSPLCMSMVQGREERGRREDIVLFYGLLTENKVVPWMNAITKNPDRYLVGVHGVSFVNTPILAAVGRNWRQGNQLLMTIHEKGLLRQTHYARGNIRFSRVSKIDDEHIDALVASIKKELERTIQYLNSLKISIASGITVQFVCPGAMVGQLREKLGSGERIRFNFHDASSVASKIGLKGAIGEVGRDSSLSLHSMFSHLRFFQLAPLNRVQFYWMRLAGHAAAVLFVLYGIATGIGPFNTYYDGLALEADRATLEENRDQKRRQYESELQLTDDPPSTPENVSAVSNVFRVLDGLELTPTQLMYYFSTGLEQNRRVRVNRVRWYVANSPDARAGQDIAPVSGEDIFQILEVDGTLNSIANENYTDVANRANALLDSLPSRSDIAVEVIEIPSRDLDVEALSGELSASFDVDAARNRDFKIRIIWRAYDKEQLEELRAGA